MSHWKNISISSSEQSERNYLPNIKKIVSYQDYVENCSHDQKIILDTKSQKMLPSIYDNLANSLSILVGPEGDFTTQEIKLALELGWKEINLGSSRLRTETAGVVVASVLAQINM
mgnify:CR=1 FL=1